MTKLLLIILGGIALSNALAASRPEPPLLIDNAQSPQPLDADN